MMSKLALLGGEAVCKTGVIPPWPPVSEETAKKLVEVYMSRKWSFGGPQETAFAEEYAAYHDAAYGIFMANGTVTLEVALHAMGVGEGDEVIVPAYTWMATAMAAKYVGAKIVFVDVEPDTLCLDPKKIEEAITPATKAIIPVHILGSMADMEDIMAIADKHGLYVIEDCAHMQGGKWNGKGVGSWGHVGSFSFQESKTVSSGEGGICITNDAELAEKMARIKHIGYPVGGVQGQAMSRPQEGLVCHNYRGLEFQGVILRDQLKGLDALLEKYNESAKAVAAAVDGVEGVRIQSPGRLATRQGYYGLGLMFDEGELADVPIGVIREALVKEGFTGLGSVYGPVTDHTLFNLPQSDWRIAGDCEVTYNLIKNRTLAITHMTLGADIEVAKNNGAILRKIAENADELKQGRVLSV